MEQFLSSAIRGLGQGSLYALLGLGFVIVYKSTRVLNLAQPALMLLGAYFTSYFALELGLGFSLALLAAAAVTALVGAAVERVAMRPMVGQPPFSAAMVTVGVFIVLQIVTSDLIGLQIRHVGDPWGLDRFRLGGVVIFHSDLAKLLITGIVLAALALFFKFTRMGLAMRATAFSQETALAQGIPVGRVFSLSWALAGALGAIAGALVGSGGAGFTPSTAFLSFKALPVIVLGGLDSILGAVVGGAVIGLTESFTKAYQADLFSWAGANVDQVMPYLVMLLVLLVRPYGLFGTPEIERV